jgi:putative OPT family oligopeptide transporter
MTICTLLIAAGLMVFFGIGGDVGKLATLGVAGVMCCAACTAGDISQDLKTGYLVGATPYRQQWMEVVGATVPAFFVAPILSALNKAHPFGAEGSELVAPQATLFANLTDGIFGGGDMHWGMVGIGIGVGLALIVLNAVLHMAGLKYRAHLMPVAVGMYLPFTLSAAIFIGGLLRFVTSRASDEDAHAMSHDSGILFGSGVIAGESLMGIALAIAVAGGFALPQGAPSMFTSALIFLAVLGIYGYAAHKRKA